MKPLGKLIALVLLVAVVSPVLPGQVLASTVPRPAGCHEHGQKSPTPSPVTYQCCRAGHQVAAVREAVDFRLGFLQLSPVMEFAVPAWAGIVGQTQSKPSVFGSPGVTSLRI